MGALAALCFHCGEPLNDSALFATIDNHRKPVCCAGCLAVAELIAGSGLGDYYRYREQPGQRPDAAVADSDPWSVYQREDIASQFTRTAEGRTTVVLLIEGLRCTACSWLIDKMLSRMEGVFDVSVNAAVGRAHVEWDATRTSLAHILRAIASLGYVPHPITDATITRAKQDESRHALKRLAVAGFGMMQVMMFAVATYSADMAGEVMEADIWRYFRSVSLLVTTPVLLYAGAPILLGAWRSVRARTIGMDVPVTIALVLAYAASVFNTWRGTGVVYFDSVTMFIFFLTLGRWVEMSVRHRTSGITDALARHLPPTAHRYAGDRLQDVATAQLSSDDLVLIRAGEIVPADAVLLEEAATVDESMLTGESLPVRRNVGERISAGSLNVGGAIRARVVAAGAATLLSGIVALLQRAQAQKPALAQAADRAAARFLQGVLITSAVACALWLMIDPTRAFAATLAVLVVACPCAFAIAMPAALAAATGELARNGVLVTRPDAIEALARTEHVIFDKTGTLTRGDVRLERIVPRADRSELECAAIAAALERDSEHPIARAFEQCRTAQVASNIRSTPGGGIEGTVAGKRYRLGAHAFSTEWCRTVDRQQRSDHGTLITLANEDGILAEFVLVDTLRAGSRDIARDLAALGVSGEILSGDGLPAVTSVARQCGIENYQARCSPQQKLLRLRSMQARGLKVAMLGDGINDAPVLGAADVSIAMGKGAALAHASADMIFIGEDLSSLTRAVRIARHTMRIARQNLYWAAAYNFGSLPLAALGFIPAWAAALGMSLSSVGVILNATRLLGSTDRQRRACIPPVTAPRSGRVALRSS
ncbi:MAG TPA: heavy metal translocating P-type ATPase [Steroidobacteraceae bacterium]|nr:heavy metal translocating P-type ATPase [Steroidobacteraceae bacterium]